MRACYILLLLEVSLMASFGAVTTSPVSGQTHLVSRTSPDTPQSIEIVQTNDDSKRSLRKHWTDNVGDRNVGLSDTEERVFSSAKVLKVLTNGGEKEQKLVQMLTGGAAGDVALFAKLYTKKATPYNLFTKMKLSELTDAEKKINEAYLKWAAYFDYWVGRNVGKIKP